MLSMYSAVFFEAELFFNESNRKTNFPLQDVSSSAFRISTDSSYRYCAFKITYFPLHRRFKSSTIVSLYRFFS